MAFWIAALAIAAAATLYVVRPLAVGRSAARPRAAHDAQVFRDQLREVARDRERGVLSEEEARAAEIEVSRRLLAAAAERERTADHPPAPRAASLALAAALLVGAPLAGYALYGAIGAPGLPDQPYAARSEGLRPGQEVAETRLGRPDAELGPEAAEAAALVKQLEERLAGDDPDPQGLFLLARSYGQLQQYRKAWRAYARLVEAEGGDVPAGIRTAMAEAMIIAAGGYVSPEAEAALTLALQREPGNPVARYYMGMAQAQLGRPAAALELWAGVLRDSPANAPWVESTQAQIDDLVARTGLPKPDAAPQPLPDEAGQRALMAGMVETLRRRLVEEGGSVDEWVQLVRSYTALGTPDQAEAARALALSAFGENAEARAAFEAQMASAPPLPPPPHRADEMRETVEALDARLRAEGGSAGAWLRLVSSWQTLGEDAKAQAAAEAARANLAGDPAQLAALDDALANRAPEGLRGPTREDVAAAAEMAPEDRMAMVRGMVDGLRDRLEADGGTAEEWSRLIRALGVLDDREGAAAAFAKAREAHGADPAALAMLRETALAAGVPAP